MSESRKGVSGGECGTSYCKNYAQWIPVSEGNAGSKVYRCVQCCDRVAEGTLVTDAQYEKLADLCERYGVPLDLQDYRVIPKSSGWMPGWVEGWVGGEPGTLYVGVDPEGRSHS